MENDDAIAREGYVEETAVRRKVTGGLRDKRESAPKKRRRWRNEKERQGGWQGVLVAGK